MIAIHTLDRLMTRIMWVITGRSHVGRMIGGVSLTLLVATCGHNESIPPANPAAPTTPILPTVPALTLSGVVAEDGHPIANAHVDLAGLQSCSSGCSSRQFNAGAGITDAAGRYSIIIRRPEEASLTVWAIASKDSYVQQCVATTTVQADASLDLRLASMTTLSTARPLSDPGLRTISGVVFEATPTGRRPVEDASVGWEGLLDTVLAATRSDAAGRYALCNLSMGRVNGLFALKQGYSNVTYTSVDAGTDAVVDIEITRR